MAAPVDTIWGPVVGNYCKLGIYVKLTHTNTQTTANVQVWLATRYSLTDNKNTLYYNVLNQAGSASTSVGSISINTTSDSSWSSTNHKKLKDETYTYERTNAASTKYVYANLTGLTKNEVNGKDIPVECTFTVPALDKYTITFDANGGTIPSGGNLNGKTSLTVTYGMTTYYIMRSDCPTLDNHTFDGWYTERSGGVKLYDASGVAVTNTGYWDSNNRWIHRGNVTVYAHWVSDKYYLNIDTIVDGVFYNRGDESVAKYSVYKDDKLALENVTDCYSEWPYGTKYTVEVSWTNSDYICISPTTVTGTITEYTNVVFEFITHGTGRIYNGESCDSYAVNIYNEDKYVRYVPYVYDDNAWKRCK